MMTEYRPKSPDFSALYSAPGPGSSDQQHFSSPQSQPSFSTSYQNYEQNQPSQPQSPYQQQQHQQYQQEQQLLQQQQQQQQQQRPLQTLQLGQYQPPPLASLQPQPQALGPYPPQPAQTPYYSLPPQIPGQLSPSQSGYGLQTPQSYQFYQPYGVNSQLPFAPQATPWYPQSTQYQAPSEPLQGLSQSQIDNPSQLDDSMPPRRSARVEAASASPAIEPSPVRTKFPTARIKRIMQADEEVGKVAQQTPIAVGKALELFMVAMVTKSADVAREKNSKRVTAQMLKRVVESDEQWDFLREIVSKVDNEERAGRAGQPKAESESDEDLGEAKKKGKGGRKKKIV